MAGRRTSGSKTAFSGGTALTGCGKVADHLQNLQRLTISRLAPLDRAEKRPRKITRSVQSLPKEIRYMKNAMAWPTLALFGFARRADTGRQRCP